MTSCFLAFLNMYFNAVLLSRPPRAPRRRMGGFGGTGGGKDSDHP